MALYRKWRPGSFDEVVGQEHVIRTLRNAITSGRIHHAHLFAGPRGTGKTTTARLLAKAVNCLAPEAERPCNQCRICQAVNEGRLLDLVEIDAASNTGVDDVRELRERVGFRPNEARYKVYVIDEVHMLSNAAFNALLKTLEEPPPHAIFVLATTEVHKIPATVLSRCQRFDFRRIPLNLIVDRLQWLAEQENIRADRDALTLIARYATGSMRDAESLLDQLASYDQDGITVEDVQAALGVGADAMVSRLVDALRARDMAAGLEAINTAIDEGADPRRFARQIVEHLRALLLLQFKSTALLVYVADDTRPQWEQQAASFTSPALSRAVRLFNDVASATTGSWQPQLPLEMAFVDAVLGPAQPGNPAPHGTGPAQAGAVAPAAAPAPGSRAASVTAAASVQKPPRIQEPKDSYPAPASEPLTLTVGMLQERWEDYLNALRPRNLPLEGLVRSCTPLAVEGDVVVLGFAYDLHRARAEGEAYKRDMEDALNELAGQRYRVRCVLAPRAQPETAPVGAPAAAARVPPPPEPEESEEPVGSGDDPLLGAARALGAEVVSRPVDDTD